MKPKILFCHALLSAGGLLTSISAIGGSETEIHSNASLITLFSFDGTNGARPCAGLVLGRDGNFYGTTCEGGASLGQGQSGVGYGTVFRVTANGVLTTLVSFNATNGANPSAALVQGKDGNFYGVTCAGGTNTVSGPKGSTRLLNAGTVFQMTPDGRLKTLYSFGGNPDGRWPVDELMQGKDGKFYGTTRFGGLDYGTVFRVEGNGGLTNILQFDLTHGHEPMGGLAQDANGNFYGTTTYGSLNGPERGAYGAVFKITADGKLVWDVCFSATNGIGPNTGLVQGPDGSFYGTTYGGCYIAADLAREPVREALNYGTIFRVTTNGVLTTLVSFDNTNGVCPVGKLILAADGNFYGAALGTTRGFEWISGGGEIFKMTPAGKLSIVAQFHGEFENSGSSEFWVDNEIGNVGPAGGLSEGPDGNLYGMTENGGKNDLGSIFKLTIRGTATKNDP